MSHTFYVICLTGRDTSILPIGTAQQSRKECSKDKKYLKRA